MWLNSVPLANPMLQHHEKQAPERQAEWRGTKEGEHRSIATVVIFISNVHVHKSNSNRSLHISLSTDWQGSFSVSYS